MTSQLAPTRKRALPGIRGPALESGLETAFEVYFEARINQFGRPGHLLARRGPGPARDVGRASSEAFDRLDRWRFGCQHTPVAGWRPPAERVGPW